MGKIYNVVSDFSESGKSILHGDVPKEDSLKFAIWNARMMLEPTLMHQTYPNFKSQHPDLIRPINITKYYHDIELHVRELDDNIWYERSFGTGQRVDVVVNLMDDDDYHYDLLVDELEKNGILQAIQNIR